MYFHPGQDSIFHISIESNVFRQAPLSFKSDAGSSQLPHEHKSPFSQKPLFGGNQTQTLP